MVPTCSPVARSIRGLKFKSRLRALPSNVSARSHFSTVCCQCWAQGRKGDQAAQARYAQAPLPAGLQLIRDLHQLRVDHGGAARQDQGVLGQALGAVYGQARQIDLVPGPVDLVRHPALGFPPPRGASSA